MPTATQSADAELRPGVVVCPVCKTKSRWPYRDSGEATCRRCQTRLVILVEDTGQCSAWAKSNDSMAEMICDWIEPDDDE